MIGVEFGYSYAGSPVIASEPGEQVRWQTTAYEPDTRPGIRLPHVWLADGTAIQDAMGQDFTLVDLTGNGALAGTAAAFADAGIPLSLFERDEPHVRQVYATSFLLVRPDLHIAWRGDEPPKNPVGLAALVSGHVPVAALTRA